ncbi:class D beta-lactamase [Metabacillus idriensis]|uniref:class D beta-lactamase n=1 Tax=Metabacillus idriensis TaxID=324768 RepID=UPI001639C85F|nr:class D beta-lactamase [Metabacillus idriensis]QNG59199.1 class D beta-lactamase [Bacillus sp. PAMC26568]
MIRAVVLLFFSFILVFSGAGVSGAQQKPEELKIQELFNGKEGTMLLENLKTDKTYVYNKVRSTKRFTAESTFKVPNALIGLQTKAVGDEYEVKRWDGVVRQFETWNRDHSLASAMRESAIWFYQDMARDVGDTRMRDYMNRMKYGNQDISGGIDSFWLDSSLKISAVEQVDFLEKLVKEKLPFEEKHQKTVKRIMIQDDQDIYTLHGKTGTRLSDFGLGWYIGFVETKKGTWLFAVNINGSGTEAKTIAIETLKQQNIIK